MKKEEFIGIAISLMLFWGIFGLIGGHGFWGGIWIQIDAIVNIVLTIIEEILFLGVMWFILTLFKNKNE